MRLKGIAFITIGFVFVGVLWIAITNLLIEKSIKENGGKSYMKFESVTANLMVEDVNKTVDFYKETFGFKAVTTVPDSGNFNFAIIVRDSVQLMLQKRESLIEDFPFFKDAEVGGSFSLFIIVENIDEVYHNAKTHCEIVKDMETTFYGMKEFTVRDINGYILTFAENTER